MVGCIKGTGPRAQEGGKIDDFRLHPEPSLNRLGRPKRCHELSKSPGITEITKNLTKITTKRTEITGTSCRYMFTRFKNVTFITVSNMLLNQRICEKYEETGSRHLVFIECGIVKSSRPKLRKSLALQLFF